jgi:hypothetical protein
MDEETRNKLVRQGVLALNALKRWFEQGSEPSTEDLRALVTLGLLSPDGLTEEGLRFVREEVPQDAGKNLHIRVFSPDGHGMYQEHDVGSFLGSTKKRIPSEVETSQFVSRVNAKMKELFPPGMCPSCEGKGLRFKAGYGLVVCPECKGRRA